MEKNYRKPDLGRWNGIDQLSEKYLSTSPYAYVANNPISMIDPDGRWMDEAGHIDTSGQGKIYFGGRQLMTQFMGQTINQGAGGYNFTGNGAVSMFNYFAAGGDMNGLSFNNGFATFWTNGDIQGFGRVTNDEMEVGGTEVVFNRIKLDTGSDWYGSAGKGNWYFGTSAVLTGFAGIVQSRQLYKQGVRRGISSNYTLTGRNLSQFGKAAMTDATVPISKIGRVGKGLGTGSFYLGVAFDAMGVINGNVSLGKALLNTGFGIAGNWGGSIGASVGTIYFAVDNFYDGAGGSGWAGFFNDANTDQRMIDEGFNQAGPYRFHIMGAHEPK